MKMHLLHSAVIEISSLRKMAELFILQVTLADCLQATRCDHSVEISLNILSSLYHLLHV